MNPHYDNVATYAKLGWVPFDKENESVSKTLEYAYDDYCIARMAKARRERPTIEYFMKRAGSFRNVFDPSVGLMRGKDSHGHWRTPYDPHRAPTPAEMALELWSKSALTSPSSAAIDAIKWRTSACATTSCRPTSLSPRLSRPTSSLPRSAGIRPGVTVVEPAR